MQIEKHIKKDSVYTYMMSSIETESFISYRYIEFNQKNLKFEIVYYLAEEEMHTQEYSANSEDYRHDIKLKNQILEFKKIIYGKLSNAEKLYLFTKDDDIKKLKGDGEI